MKDIDIEKDAALRAELKALDENKEVIKYMNSPKYKQLRREFMAIVNKTIEDNLKVMPEMKDEINKGRQSRN